MGPVQVTLFLFCFCWSRAVEKMIRIWENKDCGDGVCWWLEAGRCLIADRALNLERAMDGQF